MREKETFVPVQVIKTLKKELPHLRERYGISKLALFGSFAKGNAKPASDVDLLVELEKPLGFEFVALANELEKSLGRKVDIATFDCWKRSLANPRYRPIAEDVERTLLYVQ